MQEALQDCYSYILFCAAFLITQHKTYD